MNLLSYVEENSILTANNSLLTAHYKDVEKKEDEEEEEDRSSASDVTFMSAKEDYDSYDGELEDALVSTPCTNNDTSVVPERSSNGGNGSSSGSEKIYEKEEGKCVGKNWKETSLHTVYQDAKEYFDKFQFSDLTPDLQIFLTGINTGLPADFSPPVDKKPEWFDEKKYKLGQAFARKYFVGVEISEMLSLYILFALPDGLETLIFTKNSSTPFTSFRRYLSTVLKVLSWYDHDIWDKTTLGYKNIKAVRGMHLNVSKRINSTPFEELKTQVTLAGSTDNAPVWSNLKDIVQKDFRSSQRGCPFQTTNVAEKTGPTKVFVNQLDMGTTQWGFMGLMVVYPEKFGAAGATRQELEGFVHLWRCIGYLLGTEDKYNFCAGSFEEVVERSRQVVDKWARPNFLNVTAEWEHMSRCLAEGMSCVASPEISFEVSLLYMCYVLDVPAPNLYQTLSWGQTLSFHFLRFMMTVATRYPGVMPMLNWFAHKSLAKAASFSAEELKKLEEKKYDYETEKEKVKRKDESLSLWSSRASHLALFLVARILI